MKIVRLTIILSLCFNFAIAQTALIKISSGASFSSLKDGSSMFSEDSDEFLFGKNYSNGVGVPLSLEAAFRTGYVESGGLLIGIKFRFQAMKTRFTYNDQFIESSPRIYENIGEQFIGGYIGFDTPGHVFSMRIGAGGNYATKTIVVAETDEEYSSTKYEPGLSFLAGAGFSIPLTEDLLYLTLDYEYWMSKRQLSLDDVLIENHWQNSHVAQLGLAFFIGDY